MELNIDKPFSRKSKKKSNDEEGEPPNPISGSKTDDDFEQTKFIYDDDKETKFIYGDEKTEDDEFIYDDKKTKFIYGDEEDKFIYSEEKTMFKYDDEKTEEDDYNYGYESTEFSYGDEQSKDRLSEQDKKSEDKFVYSSKDSTGVKFDYNDEKPVDEDKFVYNEEKAEGSYLVYNNATSASTVYPNQPRQSRDESYNGTEKPNVQYKSKNKSTFSEQGNIVNDSNENLGEKFKNENKSLNQGRLTESTTESIQIKPNLSNEARTGYSDVSSNNEPPLSKSQRKKLNKQKRQADDMQTKGEFVEKREQIDDKQAQGKEVEKREQIDNKQAKGKDVEKRDQTNKQAKVKDVEKRDQTNDKQAKGNVVEKREQVNNKFVDIVFHLHLPKAINGKLVVLGNINELGNWNEPIVQLNQHKRGFFPQRRIATSYWYSNPVRIPMVRFQNVVRYKYAVFESRKNGKRTDTRLYYEGKDNKDDRVLEFQCQNQFDIWKNNADFNGRVTDYMFLKVIYDSVNLVNFKEKILEYDSILKQHHELTLAETNIKFISEHAVDKSIAKQHFLCFLLGHCRPNITGKFEFSKDFNSTAFLKQAFKVQSDTFPSDDMRIVLKGIDYLIHHNIDNGLHDWLPIFTLAPLIDPQYKFMETISLVKCDEKYIESCFENILKNKFNENTYERVIKWLIDQCNKMKMFSTIWQSINHSDKLDKQIQPYFVGRIEKYISKDDLVDLHKNFSELPEAIGSLVAAPFRERTLQLLTNSRNSIWKGSRSDSLFFLINSVHLRWTKDEYIIVLETLSNIEEYQLLSVFPLLFKNWIDKFKDTKDEKIIQICVQWYKNLIKSMALITSSSTASREVEFIISVFEKLSMIGSLLNDQIILDKLMSLTFDRIKKCVERNIFAATTGVAKFGQVVRLVFTKIIKEKIDLMRLEYDELLLKKMRTVCGCGNNLEIPNELCETILLHIMSCLQKRSSNFSELTSNQILLESANFWIVIFRATGNTEKFHSHRLIQEAGKAILELTTMINDSSIDLLLLQDLLKKYNDDELHYYLNSANFIRKFDKEIITVETLAKVRQDCQLYEKRLKKLDNFYKRFCPSHKANDVQDYLDELRERSKNLGHVSLKESLSEDHWNFHKGIMSIADVTDPFNNSRTFYNVFEKQFTLCESNEEMGVEFIANKLMQGIISDYMDICKQYENWGKLKYSKAISFWRNVSNFDDELKLMNRFGKIDKSEKFMRTIRYLSEVKVWIERLEYLSTVLEIFEVSHDWLGIEISSLRDHDLNLSTLSISFEDLDEKFSKFNHNIWALIKELSGSEEFIGFLKTIAEHDMKNLINGVDEHSDTRLIQEDTVSSLIQVKQFLNPLMTKANLTLDTFVKELNEIVNQNPSSTSKLTLCNSNNMALQNMYNTISNRGEVTKEKIQNAVKIGTYEFVKEEKNEECILTLSYVSKSETMVYGINELQDLRGRALLISKPGGSYGQVDDVKNKMDEFVTQVDFAQNIINTMKKLTQLGHFGFRKFNEVAKSTKQLEKVADRLKKELDLWVDLVNQAQENFYYLTFYPARHILAFFDYYLKTGRQYEITRTCYTLVAFVNKKAKLPSHLKSKGFSCRKGDYYLILKEIGERLENIFGTLQKQPRPIKDSGERIISDVVKRGELFVAACDDKSKVPNIIMSFYANHGSYPEPWQLLMCTTSTTEEELSIFIKRCFFAPKNGYGNHLFCITNLESLDFELQYDLVNNIRSLMERIDDYYLALICCSETGVHHHILDQFSENVHPSNGLSTIAMKAIYRELCSKVTCLTSDLSGLGKTEWIKQESYRKHLIPKTFPISDGASYNSLIRQLRDFRIRDVDSLHINIISADNPGEVNIFLFQLLTLEIVSNNTDIASLPFTNIYIEVASSVDQHLLKSLPFISCLDKPNLIWHINRLMVSQEIHSPIQVVCHYLNSYEKMELDKEDILFRPRLTSNHDNIVRAPLPPKLCQQLLDKYFFQKIDSNISSFRFLEIFINVFADQLIRLSGSSFFEVHHLSLMTNETNIRTTLFDTLLEVSKDFATKSIQTKSAQLQAVTQSQGQEQQELMNLVQWDDSNHLLVFFMSQLPDSICALYRDKSKVPINVQNLLKSQDIEKDWNLVDYHTMSSEQLLSTLERLARKTMHNIKYPPYALSVDNLLKMALMLLRTRANIPVVVCGEAGCGKTSLIGFLAKVVEVEFSALNIHAGITEQNIKDFMKEFDKKAQAKEIWLFFDEINTCNHIGLLADLIAHRMLNGKQIHPNIRLFAACNPYRIRNKSVSNVGLKTNNIRFEERSCLVYEVKPLPDQILDYVWDYGRLQPNDELTYIQIMVQESFESSSILAELLFASQEFIRNVEEPYSVSLRDVKRAIKLVNFFQDSLITRQKEGGMYPGDNPDIVTRSFILALGLCYMSRLYDRELRKRYRETMCKILLRNEKYKNIRESRFNDIIREEQLDYMKRMTCPPNTAFNEALLENVLSIIVCILCKVPLFIVGSPGSSKSLAIRLVHQNLRGFDSNDVYFRKLPQVFFIPHQGSSSSTSDGIEKVFQKAIAYQETSSSEFPVISVVLLDEVGLAETSPYNPLKVLHSLLEPSYPADGPKVSVVGISNWRLDNSKSSRALLVQRPKFDLEDLVETAVRLLNQNNLEISTSEIKNYKASLQPLAEAYSEYEANGQVVFPNFHGLRDYYALVKNLSNKEMIPENIHLALARNFGGIEEHTKNCLKSFGPVIKSFNGHKSWTCNPIPTNILIDENLNSEGSRHLMVIGKSDSIVNILSYQLKDPVIILGSQFPEDRDDYSYSILSRIMMCVEAGRSLVLTDLEIIYGSLYDLWNQNYITMGSSDNPKYFTRVALGAYANPMLHVHPDFRCILVLDEKKLKEADPPLLNRFEKQRMTMNDLLNSDDNELVSMLEEWTRQMSTMAGSMQPQHNFTRKDLFIGFNEEETLQSLIIDIRRKVPKAGETEILEKCKDALVAIATSDGMVRIDRSLLDPDEIQHWKNVYFQVQHHNDIADYFQDLLHTDEDQNGHLAIINTFSNINTDVISCLKNITKCYVVKLSTLKTEAQFQKQMNRFWLDPRSNSELLALQCDVTTVNADCIKLAKFIIEQCRNEYLQKEQENKDRKVKHACIILHLRRENNEDLTSFNFMSGWKQITIETLTKHERPLSVLLEQDLGDIIETTYPFEEILKHELLWCLLCMKYPNNVKSVNHVKYLSKYILDHPNFVNCLKLRTQEWLKTNVKQDWQYSVASNKKLLYPHSSFAMALQAQIRIIVRRPIAKILCTLERLGVTKTFFLHDLPESPMSPHSEQFLKFWKDMFMDNNVINIDSLPEPMPDIYTMPVSVFYLQFPFSFYFMNQIDSFKTLYEEELSMLSKDTENINADTGELHNYIYEDFVETFTKKIFKSITLLESSPLEDASELYFKDFVHIICNSETSVKNVSVLSYIFKCKLKENIRSPILLHIFWWKNSVATLAEFQLIHACPIILNDIIMGNDDVINTQNFEEHLVNEVTSLMLKKINKCQEKNQDIVELQLEIRNILNLCEKLSNFNKTEPFQLLQICNDLLSAELIPLKYIKEISKVGDGVEIFSTSFVVKVFEVLEKFNQSNATLFAKQSFVMRSLEIIPSDSPSRLELYHILFLDEPFPLMGQIIRSIIEEERKNDDTFSFFSCLDNPAKVLNLQRFEIINTCFETKGCHTAMAALFCDIIQKSFFAQYDLIHLSPYFRFAVEALYINGVEGLQKITAVAFLKEFVCKFWNATIQDDMLQPVELDIMETGDFDFHQLIGQINNFMDLPYPLIDSLKLYFLRDLRHRDYTMDDVKKFCQAQKYILPWLDTLSWDNSQETRLPFNVYHSFKEYDIMENNLSMLCSYNSREQFNQLLNKIKKKEADARISYIGGILNRLHVIRATKEWSHVENQAAEFLNEKIENVNSLSNIYKKTIKDVVTNQHAMLYLDSNVNNTDLLIKSVIGHVIALHSSIQADASPLAYLLHNLSACSGLYILTCPSDVESLVLSVILQRNGNITRYKCQCGYLYLIGDCGQANGRGKCPECNNSIGGENHISDAGNVKLDESPIRKPISSKDEKGYIGESLNMDINYHHRNLSPTSYRILHLFVHSIIGAWAPSGTATTFLQKINNNANDSVAYCMGHIKNDWQILLKLLNCSEENLALLLHAILDRMFKTPPNRTSLKTPEEREEWETNFARNYVLPLIKNVTITTTEFRVKLANPQENSNFIEREINQTIPMTTQYMCEYLPRLWRSIGTTSFQGFRAYYNSDTENHESRYPFISVFFRYFNKLEEVKYLWPIVNFVQIISSRLGYRVSREKAQEKTFKQFIDEESNDGEFEEVLKFLTLNFNEFATAWNAVIGSVDQFQCHELQKPKPNISMKSPIALALVEPKDSGVYLCAILEYLIGLQNNFLQEVLTIPIGSTKALQFLEERYSISGNTVTSSSSKTYDANPTERPTRYYLQSLRIDQTKQKNFINYKWDDNILQNSDRNLEIGRGQDVIYDLQKIEMELARRLVFEKVHIDTLKGSQAYMETFSYHMELFQGYMRILGDIKSLIPQQKIPSDKISLIMGATNRSRYNLSSLSYDNASELLSSLEVLLCFVKRTSVGSEETKILDYVNHWMKLSVLVESKPFKILLNIGLCLKHLIALYELVEEQVANSVIPYIDERFKVELTEEVKGEIDLVVEFERSSMNTQRIPAGAFAIALKRFMLRFLKDFNKDQVPLIYYITDEGLNLWPADVSEELLETIPDSLLVCHIYEAYIYVNSKNEEIMKSYKQPGGNNRIENWNNSRFDSSEVDNTESMTASHSDFSSSFAGPSNSSSFAESSSPRQQKPRKRGRKYGSKYDVL